MAMVRPLTSERTCRVRHWAQGVSMGGGAAVDEVSDEIQQLGRTGLSPDIFRVEEERRFESLSACPASLVNFFKEHQASLLERISRLSTAEIARQMESLLSQAYRHEGDRMVPADEGAVRTLEMWTTAFNAAVRRDPDFLTRVRDPRVSILHSIADPNLLPEDRETLWRLYKEPRSLGNGTGNPVMQRYWDRYVQWARSDVSDPSESSSSRSRLLFQEAVRLWDPSLLVPTDARELARSAGVEDRWSAARRLSNDMLTERLGDLRSLLPVSESSGTRHSLAAEIFAIDLIMAERGLDPTAPSSSLRNLPMPFRNTPKSQLYGRLNHLPVSCLGRAMVRRELLAELTEVYRSFWEATRHVSELVPALDQLGVYQRVLVEGYVGTGIVSPQEVRDLFQETANHYAADSCHDLSWENLEDRMRQSNVSYFRPGQLTFLDSALLHRHRGLADAVRADVDWVFLLPRSVMNRHGAWAGSISGMHVIFIASDGIRSPQELQYLMAHELSHIEWSQRYIGTPMAMDNALDETRARQSGREVLVQMPHPNDDAMESYLNTDGTIIRAIQNYLSDPSRDPHEILPLSNINDHEFFRFNLAPGQILGVAYRELQGLVSPEHESVWMSHVLSHYREKADSPSERNEVERELTALNRLRPEEISRTFTASSPLFQIWISLGCLNAHEVTITFTGESWRRFCRQTAIRMMVNRNVIELSAFLMHGLVSK